VIVFICPQCQHRYSVQDCQAGNKFACDACSQRIQVPTPINVAPADSIPTSGGRSMIRFMCPSCNSPLSAPFDCGGRTTKCRHCGHPITVPA
jgi:DNA-directed RNA polymerase subunit RPC12/RpoP